MPDLSLPGTRVTAIPRGFAARVGDAVRYAISGVTPATWFGPLQPLKPMATEGTAGRAFDYPAGYNLQYQPRANEAVTFDDLRALACGCDLLRLVIETRKDQIEAQDWEVLPRKRADGGHPKASEFAAEISAAKAFFASPDRRLDLPGWIRVVAEELFVTDAVSIYVRPDIKGRVFAFEPIDGATIAPRIDAWGRTPQPPDVAYQQILHGVPAADFSTDDLIYFPRNRRPGHVYGYSPVEQVINSANTLIRRNAHQLAYYTDGNLVDAMLIAPPSVTNDKIAAWQRFWDGNFAGNISQRRHGIWVPSGSDIRELKQPNLKDAYDEFLARIICFAFSISPQPLVSMMNRATAETAHDSAMEEGLVPVLNYFRRLFRILFDRLGWHDIEMVPIDDRETDPRTADDIDVADVKAGIRTINEVRAARGLDPQPGGDALMIATGSGYVPLKAANAPPATSPDGQPTVTSEKVSLGPLRKHWEPDQHPRWPAGAPESQGGQFSPRMTGGREDAVPNAPAHNRSTSPRISTSHSTSASEDRASLSEKRLQHFGDKFGADAAKLIVQSPTLSNGILRLEMTRWRILTSSGRGSYTSREKKIIYPDASEKGDPATLVQSLSHEIGHACYNSAPDKSSRETYVRDQLGDEGMATISNIRIEREILSAGGPDIGIAGNHANAKYYNDAYDQFLKDGNMTKAKDAIGAFYGSNERTSTTGETYGDYYGRFYDRHYGKKRSQAR